MVEVAKRDNVKGLKMAFLDKYKNQFKKLGYTQFDYNHNVQNNNLNLYNLFFASEHKIALKFWREATTCDETGQISFFSQLN